MEDRLRECPRCGSKAGRVPRFNLGYVGDGISCSLRNCGIETPKHLVGDEAIKWWNTSATDQLMEEMEGALKALKNHCMTVAVVYPYMDVSQTLADQVNQALQKYREMKDAK